MKALHPCGVAAGAGWALGLLALLIALTHGIAMVFFPLQADYGEGVVLHLTDALARGESIYRDPQSYPWLVSPYAPLHPWLASLLGGGLAGGRLVSLLAGVGCAALVGLVAARRGGLPAGLAGAAVFVATPLFIEWVGLDRVDFLALLCELAGLAWVDAWLRDEQPDPRLAIGVAALLFSLAFWTKQSYVMGMLAASFCVGARSPQHGVALFATSLAAIAVPFAILDARSGGFLFDILFRFNALPWEPDPAWTWLSAWLATVPVAVPLAFLAYLRWGREAPLWAVYAALSLVTAAGVGRLGAYYNYFLPLQAAAAVGCGLAFARLRPRLAGLLLVAQCLAGFLISLPPFPSPLARKAVFPMLVNGRLAAAMADARAQLQAYERLLAPYPGPLLAENLAPPVQIGRPSALCDPITLFALAGLRRWDDAALRRAIAGRRFAAVLLQDTTDANLRFPALHVGLILQHYEPRWRVGPDTILLPRGR